MAVLIYNHKSIGMIRMLHLLHENTHNQTESARKADRVPKYTIVHKTICHNFQQHAKFTGLTQIQRPTAILSTRDLMLQTSKLETPLTLCQTRKCASQL